jgi:hypothetical protein
MTLTDNNAPGLGGAIMNNGGTLTIAGSTLNNSSAVLGGA